MFAIRTQDFVLGFHMPSLRDFAVSSAASWLRGFISPRRKNAPFSMGRVEAEGGRRYAACGRIAARTLLRVLSSKFML